MPAAPYVASLARNLDAYPQALLDGTFRIVVGCAMIDEDLLVLQSGARGAVRADGTPVVLIPGTPPRELVPGSRIRGGGGHYRIESFRDAGQGGWRLAEPIPRRCVEAARGVQLMAPLSAIFPAPTHSERLFAAVARPDESPAPLAPVGGTLRVADQCLMLGDDLLILPPYSWAEFDMDGRLVVRIAKRGHGDSVLARPGDRIAGSGAFTSPQGSALAPMPRPLIAPVPERCRPPGRGAVALNPEPTVHPGASDYRDPGAGATLVVPPPAPPPPVSNPASCPAGTRLSFGLCRRPDGSVVVVHERRPQ
jgi:hypothetical protein